MGGGGSLTLPGGAAGLAFIHTKYSSDRDKSRPDIELVMGAGSLAGETIGVLRSLLGKSNYCNDVNRLPLIITIPFVQFIPCVRTCI